MLVQATGDLFFFPCDSVSPPPEIPSPPPNAGIPPPASHCLAPALRRSSQTDFLPDTIPLFQWIEYDNTKRCAEKVLPVGKPGEGPSAKCRYPFANEKGGMEGSKEQER